MQLYLFKRDAPYGTLLREPGAARPCRRNLGKPIRGGRRASA